MLSSLARGYGSWTGDIDLCQSKEHTNDSFPVVGYPDPHRHGITVTPRGQPNTPAMAASSQRIRFENADGKVDIPKTFLTRKGALLLFTAPDQTESVESFGQRVVPRHHKGKKLLDLSLKLGTLDRLCKSVLQYGDEEYDRENSSVTDPRNKLFLKFTKQTSDLDDGKFDLHSQPGADLGFYLRDLKSRASSRIYGSADPWSLSRSPELREILRDLDGALPRTKRSATFTDFTEYPRGSPKQRVLSSKKLTASLKSSTYLGRPASAVSASTTPVSESVGNLPRIPPESSGRSRSSTKSGLWVQGYDFPSKSEDQRSSKSSAKSRSSKSSAKSRSSKSSTKSKSGQHGATFSENDQTTKHVIPASQTEDDITSAADEQEILLPSDAEDEDGFGEDEKDQWPVTEVITTEVSYREGSPAGDAKDVQSMTQPLMPQYTATDREESGDLDVPEQEEEDLNLDDSHQHMAGGDSDPTGIQDILVVTRVATPVSHCSPAQLSQSPTQSEHPYESEAKEMNPEINPEDVPDVNEAMTVADAVDVAFLEAGEDVTVPDTHQLGTVEDIIEDADEDVTVADADAVLAAADLDTEDVSNDMPCDDGAEEVKLCTELPEQETQDSQDAVEPIPEVKPDVVSDEPVSEVKPDVVSEIKPDVVSDEPVSEVKPDVVSDEPVSEVKPDVVSDEPVSEVKPDVVSDEPVSEVKPDVVSDEPVSEVKPDVVSDEPVSEVKPDVVSDEPVQETRPLSATNRTVSKANRTLDEKDVSRQNSEAGSVKGSATDDLVTACAGNINDSGQEPSETAADVKADPLSLSESGSKHRSRSGSATTGPVSGPVSITVEDHSELVPSMTEPVMHVEADEGEKRDDALMTPVPYVAKETTETDTSGGLTPEAEQLLDKEIDQMSVGTGEEEAKETSSDAGEPKLTAADESQTLTEAGEPFAGDSAEGTGVPDAEDTHGDEEGKVSPVSTAEADVDKGVVSPDPSVKEKGKVTFSEKVSMQTVPKTSELTKKQPQPPKTKAPSKPAPKQRVVKGGNQKGGKVENKTFVKALDISSVQPDEIPAEEQVTEEELPVPEKKVRQKLPPARHVETKSDKTKSSVLPSHMKDVLHRRSASKSQEELENEMAQMSEALEHTLAGPTLAVDWGEGLTAEELTLAQEALLERVKEAESKIDSVAKKKTPHKAAAPMKKLVDAKSRKKKAGTAEEKRDLQKERAAIREQRKREKQQRLEEAMALQEKIKAREAKRKAEEEEARRKAEDLAEEIAELKREEEEIQQAEDDARRQLALSRKKEREAREQRRREDLERRKQEAIKRREKEKQMMEAARQKEEEMLKRIADNEMKRQLQEDEARKREEEETMAQEKYEEELREAQKEAEEDEQRMQELEKEAEEEAMQRLVDEREEAERRRWKLKELARQMEEEEERKRQLMLEEEQRLEEERKHKELEEQQKLMEERIRLMELQRMEAEARETMRHELERRRDWAQRRRETNLERRENLDNVRHGQGITRAWVFSYFPDWPLDSYNKLMGADAKKNLGFRPKPKPKPPPEKPAEKQGETTEEPPPDSDLAL